MSSTGGTILWDNTTRQYRLQQWALAIQDQKHSGLKVSEWCELHSISQDAFFYRQRAVRKALAQTDVGHVLLPSGPVFAEVKLPKQETTYSGSAVQACIHIAYTDILLNENASVQLISNILKAVQSC